MLPLDLLIWRAAPLAYRAACPFILLDAHILPIRLHGMYQASLLRHHIALAALHHHLTTATFGYDQIVRGMQALLTLPRGLPLTTRLLFQEEWRFPKGGHGKLREIRVTRRIVHL